MLYRPTAAKTGPHRVAITGAGVVTALGFGWRANAAGFRLGHPAFSPVRLFDVSRQRARLAAQIDLPNPAHWPGPALGPRRLSRVDRAARILLLAANEAWRQSGWQPADNLPLVLGTTSAGMSQGEAYYRQAIAPPVSYRHQAARILHYQAQLQVLDVADALGFSGPATILSNACASGANALGHAWDLVHTGRAERVLTGGYDALNQMVFAGFDSLQALTTTSCRPFDTQRDGLALGEGAAVFTLETLDDARQRGAEILGEIVGYGATTDLHHLTQPHPDGDAALASMLEACQTAGVRPDQIDYLNAHGTGTVLNDASEAAAINRWAGPHAPSLPVSSTKACIGHLLGAAGAVEAAICLMALQEQWIPPTTTLETPDPACRFQLIRQPIEARLDWVMSNSFGFGGTNATLILRRRP